jgi:hypothetical protein
MERGLKRGGGENSSLHQYIRERCANKMHDNMYRKNMIHGGIECSQENRLKDIKTIARDSCPSNSAKVSSITNSSILSTALF